MSRPLRIEYPGAWYHIMNRGRRRETIFEDEQDCRMFIELMKEAAKLWGVRVSAYCLMSNHYHMLIQTPRGNLSRCMRHINGVYTQRFNRVHGYDGQLFRGRFKSILVEGDNYLLGLVRYIHHNPLRAGVTDKLEVYPWSSHKGYLSSAKDWDWLNKGFILSLASSGTRGQRKAYKQFMEEQDTQAIINVLENAKWPALLGDDDFVSRIKGKYFDTKRNEQIPESMLLAPDLTLIKKEICSYYHVDVNVLLKPRRGINNEARDMAIYLARRLCNMGLKDIGVEFGLRGYSSTGSVLERMDRLLLKDKKLNRRYGEIKKSLLKGQTET